MNVTFSKIKMTRPEHVPRHPKQFLNTIPGQDGAKKIIGIPTFSEQIKLTRNKKNSSKKLLDSNPSKILNIYDFLVEENSLFRKGSERNLSLSLSLRI